MIASDALSFLGALSGLVASVGLVVMSVLFVRHARDVRHLRQWAADRPERDALVRQRPAAPIARRRGEQAALRQARRARASIRAGTIIPRLATGGALLGAIAVIVTLISTDPLGHAPSATHRSLWLSAGDPEPGQVRVLNAAGVPGLAVHAADLLRQAGLHVVGVGNAPPRAVSHIEAGTDDRPAAFRVARALAVKRVWRVATKDSARGVDIVVTIGSDAATISPLG